MHPYSELLFQSSLITVRWYGFLIALGVLLAYYFSLREVRLLKISESKFDSVFLLTLFFGIVGARIGFVVQNTTYFSSHIIEMFRIWDGGLSIHGALILGAITLFVSARNLKINIIKVANVIAPNVMLAAAIGRWGNFFNQEIVGKPTDSALKLFIDPAKRPVGFEDVANYHPVFLYESILLLIGFIIFRIFKNRLEGFALAYTLIIYSSIRIIIEFWRIDYKPILIGLDLAQIVSCGIIVITLVFYFAGKRSLTSSAA